MMLSDARIARIDTRRWQSGRVTYSKDTDAVGGIR